ncbi:MAG: tRNA (guanosine(37)-N1)-methyltransferase TrmD [Candidatus Marinimicrobia bacterium CG08_land_8_20_14_0_20_45_22]|nr:MAG: tRNA (guanosine(37)-N1)-methyltransferase TrmD [Candidatus Marinimicrobia bacterium CG08_land_8_20_14_0_20_45_22]
MKIFVVTAFPGMVNACLSESMFRKATEKNAVTFEVWNLRDFSRDKHKQIDDTPYGGGAGMVLKPEPFFRAYDRIRKLVGKPKPRVIFPSPQGKTFDHATAVGLAKEKDLTFFCGHYKGVDERVLEKLVTDEISLGDYVATGGELPTLMMIDAIIRHVPGVLHAYESAETDSFADDLLEGPIYTHPQKYRRLSVPEVLTSGNHAKITDWKYGQRLKRTRERRTDLIEKLTENNDSGGKNG